MSVRAAPPVAASIRRTGLVISLAFAVLAAGAGWWQVIEARRLSTAPDNPAMQALERRALRGEIVDRNGRWLAHSSRDANGEALRTYRDTTISHVIGYASRRYGTTGLERAYNTQLLGLGGDPLDELLGKFRPAPSEPLGLRLSIDLILQRAAVAALGDDRGAVVMLDPATGEVHVLASTPTYDATALADPTAAESVFSALVASTDDPLLPRATLGRYTPGSVLKVVTALAALDAGAVTAGTTFPEQPPAEVDGLLVEGFRIRDGHHPATGRRALDLARATEVSCNIWYALAGLQTGGRALVDTAARLGFDAQLPFELPTAVSQVTDGDGPAPGGFLDDVELASAAFGQGEAFVTPLQMALVAATVANDGVLMRPRLVLEMRDRSDRVVRSFRPERVRRVVSAADAQLVQEAMRRAVEGSLGRQFTSGARVPGVPTAGKSGSAQLDGAGRPHSWFIGFAPVDAPRIAIAVVVERGGRGGERAAPIAGALMRRFFEGGGPG